MRNGSSAGSAPLAKSTARWPTESAAIARRSISPRTREPAYRRRVPHRRRPDRRSPLRPRSRRRRGEVEAPSRSGFRGAVRRAAALDGLLGRLGAPGSRRRADRRGRRGAVLHVDDGRPARRRGRARQAATSSTPTRSAPRRPPPRARRPASAARSPGCSTTRSRCRSAEQARAVVDGVVLGGYDPGRWKTEGEPSASRSSGSTLVGGDDERCGRRERAGASRPGRTARATSRTRRRTS